MAICKIRIYISIYNSKEKLHEKIFGRNGCFFDQRLQCAAGAEF